MTETISKEVSLEESVLVECASLSTPAVIRLIVWLACCLSNWQFVLLSIHSRACLQSSASMHQFVICVTTASYTEVDCAFESILLLQTLIMPILCLQTFGLVTMGNLASLN